MDSEIIKDLVYNSSLLLSISIIYNTFFFKIDKDKKLNKILLGIAVGIIGILLMNSPAEVSSGVFFDTRSILISATGMFLGFIPTVVAVIIISLFRIIIGGSGATMGVLVTITTAGVGLLWNYLRFNKIFPKSSNTLIEFYIVGLITHIGMLFCTLALPKNIMFVVLKQIALPVLLIYPIGSLVLSTVLLNGFIYRQTRLLLKESEERFRTIYEQSPLGVGTGDLLNGQLTDVNQKFAEITCRTKEELLNIDFKSITHPDDINDEMKYLYQLNTGAIKSFNMIKRFICPDNSIVWVNIIVSSIKISDSSGVFKKTNLILIEAINDRIKAEEKLRESKIKYKNLYIENQHKQSLLKSLINSIPDLIFYKDKNSVYLGGNIAFANFAGMEEKKLIGLTDLDLFSKDMATLFRTMDLEMMNQGSSKKNEEIVTYPDGNNVCLETLKTPYYDPNGNILGLIGISRDITERKKKEEEIIYLNLHDVLTGLYNRTFFEEERKRLDIKSQLPLSIIFGDINGLKLINDAFGHAQGDKLLIEIANILKQCIREEDVVARTGGDEFCILLPQTDSQVAQSILDKIKESCANIAKDVKKAPYYASISLGHSTKTDETESFEKVIKIAEDFMYRRKLLEHESLHNSIISSIKMAMFEKSHETQEHAERLTVLSKKLGQALNLPDEQLVELELLSTLHDIGKISVDQKILLKIDTLTAEDWAEIRKHPEVGYRITNASPGLKNIAEYIISHHERWDGKGYPKGLIREEIPLLSRIISIVDSYDAMTQDRSYRKAMTKENAIAEIQKNAGTQFDPQIAETFIKIMED